MSTNIQTNTNILTGREGATFTLKAASDGVTTVPATTMDSGAIVDTSPPRRR